MGIFSNAINSRFLICAGNGERTKFWTDHWIQGTILKERFKRLFCLAINKDDYISDYVLWNEDKYEWNLAMRRPLFDWETDIWEEFISMLNSTTLSRQVQDKLVMTSAHDGIYTPSSYRSFVDQLQHSENSILYQVWKGYAPPKIEIFVWKALIGKISVAEVLHNRNCRTITSPYCVFCHKMESISHLFIHCDQSWSIWMRLCNSWNLNLVMPSSLTDLFISWNSLLMKPPHKELWSSVFFATIWSIWLARNDKVFNNKELSIGVICDLIKLRVGWWFKAKYEDASLLSSIDFITNIQDITLPCAGKPLRANVIWVPPPNTSWKINCDGSAKGKPSPVGIGSVIRDHNGTILFLLSKSIGITESNHAELLALVETLEQLSSCPRSLPSQFFLESDSSLIIAWMMNT